LILITLPTLPASHALASRGGLTSRRAFGAECRSATRLLSLMGNSLTL